MAEAVGLKTFFSIRQYTARIRSVDLEICWPFSEVEENKSLPQMTWRRHKWWSSELESVGSVTPELKDVDEELDDDDEEVGVPGTTPKKRSIVELFAIAPQIAGTGEEEEEEEEEVEEDSEKDAGLIGDATKRKSRRRKKKMTTKEESLKDFVPNNNNNNRKKKKKKKKMQKWEEMDGNRGRLTSTSTHPEKDKKDKSGIHRPNNRSKVKVVNKIDLDVSKMILKRCGEPNKKTGQLKKKKLHGKSKKADHVLGILKNKECAEKDGLPNVLDITKCRRAKHHVKRVSFHEEEQPEPEPPASDNNIAVLVVDGDDMGISPSGGDLGKREEEIGKPAFSYSLDLNHSLTPSCSESESFEPVNCHLGSLHGITNQVEVEQGTTGSSRHESHTFRCQLSPSACVSVPASSVMISESWESSEDRLWNRCAFNLNPYFQVPYKPLPFGVRDAESVNPQHTYRDFFSGLPLNSRGDIIERQAGQTTAFSMQNYIKPTCNWENPEMKDPSLLFPKNFPEISVLDMDAQEQAPQNEYDHHQHACRLRPAGQIIPGRETSGSSDRPTMRLMGKNFTVGKNIEQLHGSEDGQVWTDKEIIAEQKQEEKQNGACSTCFSGGVGRSSCLNVGGHLGIEAQHPPMIGNYFHNDRLQHPSENHFSAMNFYSSHGRNSTATSSHQYHHHRNQSLTGRTPSSANSSAFLNQDHGRNRPRHEFPTHNLQQWLMDTSQNFAPPYHTQFYDQYHHHHNQHPRMTSRPHSLHPFSTTPHFPPPPPPTPPTFHMTSSSANIPFIPQFPVVKPDSVTDLDNWKQRMSRITCLEEPDRIMKKLNHTNPAAEKKPNSLAIACHDHVVDVEQEEEEEEEERIILTGLELNGGWAQRGDKVIDVGNINVSTSRFGGPIKLSAGAKHILKPCQKKMDSDNTRLTYSTRPFALLNETAPSLRPHTVAMKKSARIYQF